MTHAFLPTAGKCARDNITRPPQRFNLLIYCIVHPIFGRFNIVWWSILSGVFAMYLFIQSHICWTFYLCCVFVCLLLHSPRLLTLAAARYRIVVFQYGHVWICIIMHRNHGKANKCGTRGKAFALIGNFNLNYWFCVCVCLFLCEYNNRTHRFPCHTIKFLSRR